MKGFSNTICVTFINKNVKNVCKHTFARFVWALRAQSVCDVEQQIQGLTHSSKRTHGVLACVVREGFSNTTCVTLINTYKIGRVPGLHTPSYRGSDCELLSGPTHTRDSECELL